MSATYLGKLDEEEYKSYISKREPSKEKEEITYLGRAPSEELEGELVQGRDIARAGKVAASRIIGLPQNIKDMVDNILNWGIEKATGKDLTKMKEAEESARILPRSEEVSKYIESKFPSTAPRTAGEEKAEDIIGTFVDLAMPLPGEKLKVGAHLVRPILGTAAGEAAQYGAEALGQEKQKGWVKAIAQVIPMVVGGKLKPTEKEMADLYEAGKSLGLSEKELTPLLQSEKRIAFFGKAAKKSQKMTETLEAASNKLGNVLGNVSQEAKSMPPLSVSQTKGFAEKLEELAHDLKKTVTPSEEKAKAIKFLEDGVKDLQAGKSVDIEHLVNYYRDINKTVNWGSVGQKYLTQAKDIIKDTIREISPEFSHKFESANKLYARMKNFEDKVGWSREAENKAFAAEAGAFIYSTLSGNWGSGVKTLALERSLRKIASEALTNPKWQNITRTSIRAAKEQSPKLANAAYRLLKDKVKKDMPEEYDEINWPD